MAVRIEAVSAIRHPGKSASVGSRELAASCARRCLAQTGADRLSLLIYAGVFRDAHLVEPAQAPYAQRSLGASAGVGAGGADAALSFDVDQLLVGVEIAEGLLPRQPSSRALLLAADACESFAQTRGEALTPAAGAMLLTSSDEGDGFVAFHSAVFPAHRARREAKLVWRDEGSDGRATGHVMVAEQSEGYLEACLSCAETGLGAFIEEVGIRLRDGLLLVPSQAPEGFARRLRERLGLTPGSVVEVPTDGAALRTAGPIVALDLAMSDGRWASAREVVFLTVAPGIVTSAALYRKGRG